MKISELAEFCSYDEWGQRRVSIATQHRIYENAARRLEEYFGDIRITELSPRSLIEWQTWLDGRGTAVATRNTYVRSTRAMLNYAKSRGFELCEMGGVFKFKREARRVKSVAVPNAWRMLAASGLRDAALFWLAMDSARRRGGLARLKVGDFAIKTVQGQFRVIGRTIEKGDKEQILLAGHDAAMVLQAWLTVREELLKALGVADHGYVFVNLHNGQPLSLSSISGLADKLAKSAGIPKQDPTNLHAFRHMRAKQLLKDLSLPEVRDILGHTSAKTTADIYAVYSEDELIKAFFGGDGEGEETAVTLN